MEMVQIIALYNNLTNDGQEQTTCTLNLIVPPIVVALIANM